MKSILFASTALVAFAGAAAADVTLSGSAEMGIFDTDAVGTDPQFFTDIDVTFTLSGETDGGLTFGAAIDIDESTLADGDGAVGREVGLDGILNTPDDDFTLDNGVGSNGAFGDNTDDGGIAIFISGGFGTLTMGDTDGAVDWALQEVNFGSGSIADDETSHAGFNGNSALDGFNGGDGQILRYDTTFGGFGVAVSIEQQDDGQGDEILGLGAKYSLDLGGSTVGLGIGYQETDDSDAVGVSANTTFGAVSAGISYLSLDGLDPIGTDSYDHFGIGAAYSAGAFTVGANYGQYDFDDGGESDGFGLDVGFDLGGGAVVKFGYGNGENRGVDSESYSLGVAMSF
jgi:outer membrane protein OmpU